MSGQMDEGERGGLASAVRQALGPAVGGFAVLVVLALLMGLIRGDSDDSDPVAVAILFIALGLFAFGLMIAGGFLAAKGLRSESMESGSGVFAVRMAVVLAIVLPVMTLVFGLLAATDTWERDSEPFIGAWLVLALVASVIGGFAPEPGRRGLLVIPFLIGVAALVLVLSEATGIT